MELIPGTWGKCKCLFRTCYSSTENWSWDVATSIIWFKWTKWAAQELNPEYMYLISPEWGWVWLSLNCNKETPLSPLLSSGLPQQATPTSRWRPGSPRKGRGGGVTEHHGKELQRLLPSTNTVLQQNTASSKKAWNIDKVGLKTLNHRGVGDALVFLI